MQIAEWRNAHPGERILEIDLPLSYGIVSEESGSGGNKKQQQPLNVVSFRWDPTRETGVFIKVNCISTEFTLKKHGGEKGVPFRLQVETYDGDVRLHAAGCVLQVFKLKGADRKHKQDREKVSKRPPAEQEKFAPSYDCTVLTNLAVDNIYVPPAESPNSSAAAGNNGDFTGGGGGGTRGARKIKGEDDHSRSASPSSRFANQRSSSSSSTPLKGSHHHKNGEGGGGGRSGSESRRRRSSPASSDSDHGPPARRRGFPPPPPRPTRDGDENTRANAPEDDDLRARLSGQPLPASASADAVLSWLRANRYGGTAAARELRGFDARDLLRLSREDLVAICGLASGIRLFNDLHRAVVAPSTTLYVAPRGAREYSALFLAERTVSELVARLAESVGLRPELFGRVFLVGPMPDMLIRVTDAVVQYTKPDSAFQFFIREQQQQQQQEGGGQQQQQPPCDIVLESVLVSPVHSSQESLHQLPPGPPAHGGGGGLDGGDNANGDSVENLSVPPPPFAPGGGAGGGGGSGGEAEFHGGNAGSVGSGGGGGGGGGPMRRDSVRRQQQQQQH